MKPVFLWCVLGIIFLRANAQQTNSVSINEPPSNAFIYPQQLSVHLPDIHEYKILSDEDKLIYLASAIVFAARWEGPTALKTGEARKTAQLLSLPPGFEFFLAQKSHAFSALLLKLALSRSALARIGPVLSSLGGSLFRKSVMPASEQAVHITNILNKQNKVLDLVADLSRQKKTKSLTPSEASLLKKQIGTLTKEIKTDIELYRRSGGDVKALAEAGIKAKKSWAARIGSFAVTGAASYAIFEVFDRLISMKDSDKQIPTLISNSDSSTPVVLGKEGSPCVYGLYPSSLIKKDKGLACARPTFESGICAKTDFLCPDFGMALGNVKTQKKFCIKENSPAESTSARCGALFLRELQTTIDKKATMTTSDRQTIDLQLKENDVLRLVTLIKSLTSQWETERLLSGKNTKGKISIHHYCNDETSSGLDLRTKECQAIREFVLHLKSTKVSNRLFASESPPGLKKEKEPAAAATK